MTFSLSASSQLKLQLVHKDLQAVVEEAIKNTDIDFCVLEGLRTLERQKALVASGASQTLDSRHLTGHAVDLGAMLDGKIDWHPTLYTQIAHAMKMASAKLHTPIEWGGNFPHFKDLVHFQLPRKFYP